MPIEVEGVTPDHLPPLGGSVRTDAVIIVTQDGIVGQGTLLDIINLVNARDGATVTALSNVAGTVTIDCSLGDYFTLVLGANVTTIAFTNLPGSGRGASKMLRITQGSGPYTVAWPASFKWAGGTPGAVSTANGAVDLVALTTYDNGTTWNVTIAKAFA